MAFTTTTTNMGLILPIPTQELGPAWAVELNTALGVVDEHDHSPGKGAIVTTDGINITSDLSFNNSANLTEARSLRLSPLNSVISDTADVGCLFVVGNELYYNDVTGGNHIKMTDNGSVSGNAGTITGLPSGTASADYDNVTGTFVFEQATSTAANMDFGSIVLRYPGSYPTPSGNYIAIEAPSSLSGGHTLTLPIPPAQTNVMTLAADGVISSVTWNTVAENRTRPASSTAGLGGVAISATATSSTTNTSLVNIPSASITIVTSGRPVFVSLMPDGSTTQAGVSGNPIAVGFARNTVSICRSQLSAGTAAPGQFFYIDTPAAGSYTYDAQYASPNGSSVSVTTVKLVVYEL